jgi:hypothetical protein
VTPEGTRDGWPSPDGTLVLARAQQGGFSLYPIAGGAPTPVTGLAPDASIVRFSPDGRAIYSYRRSELPARLMRLELASGRSQLVRELAPADRAGIFSIFEISLADDPRWYVYNPWRVFSSLFVIEAAPPHP